MVFCGQCGFQLPPGATRCPHCGAAIDTAAANADAFHPDDPTVAVSPYVQQHEVLPSYSAAPNAAGSYTPAEQQQLVLHSDNRDYDYRIPGADEPTSVGNTTDYRTDQGMPLDYHTGTPNPGYPNAANYPAYSTPNYHSVANYPAYSAPNYHSAANYAPQQSEYADFVPPAGAAYQPGDYQSVQQPRRRGRFPTLFIVVVALVVLLGAIAVFAQHRTNLLGGNTGSGGSSSSVGNTPTNATPTDQAKALVQQYYTDINNKDYQTAYGLWNWNGNGPTLEKFERGYAQTAHDALTINDATQLSDGTVKVSMTIVATENVGAKTRQHTYTGYYIVGQNGNTLKILRGYLK